MTVPLPVSSDVLELDGLPIDGRQKPIVVPVRCVTSARRNVERLRLRGNNRDCPKRRLRMRKRNEIWLRNLEKLFLEVGHNETSDFISYKCALGNRDKLRFN